MRAMRTYLPNTSKYAEPEICPASLALMHVYIPASLFFTAANNKSPFSNIWIRPEISTSFCSAIN